MAAPKRLAKELSDIKKDCPEAITAAPIDEKDLFNW